MSNARWIALVDDLRQLPAETEWVEFKVSNSDPTRIGRTISALANVACIWGEPYAYMIWGVEDGTHEVVGTSFEPKKAKQGAQELELWLAQGLSPSPAFKFVPIDHPNGKVVLLEVPAANTVPVKFQSISYIRVGSTTPKLSDYPQREADLVSKIRPFVWEHASAESFVSGETVLSRLDATSYFALIKRETPVNPAEMLEHMRADRLIAADVGGKWNILNLGAMLFAQKLTDFSELERKGLRIVHYDGETRSRSKRTRDGTRGYANGFQNALHFVDGLLPSVEVISDGIRTAVRPFPEIAIRELLANALIHQDLTMSGTSPIVEIFDNRVEITNPGVPVTDMLRKLFGAPPRSRNESMAKLMRRMGICEELGSGLVKVIEAVEDQRLPPPLFETADGHTRVTLFGPRPFSEWDRGERMQVTYQHACLMRHRGRRMTNATLRNRFGLPDSAISQVSRIIKETVDIGAIKSADPGGQAGYVPFWA